MVELCGDQPRSFPHGVIENPKSLGHVTRHGERPDHRSQSLETKGAVVRPFRGNAGILDRVVEGSNLAYGDAHRPIEEGF
jgi:hypothetical protein